MLGRDQEESARLKTALPLLRAELEGCADYQELEAIVGTDDRLSRFLVSRRFDIPSTKEMVLNHITWRKENELEQWREMVKDKPFLVRSLPHKSELHNQGFGMVQCAIHAGASRFGEAIFLEIMGGEKQATEIVENEELITKQLVEYYTCFLEKRSIVLEQLSREQGRRVCTLQVREVSKMSFMPKSGAFSLVQKIMSMGMHNYPESASVVLFVNPPSIFAAIVAVVKRWLPEETNRKFKFLTKQEMPNELMKFMRPRTILALQRLEFGEDGDDLSQELCSDSFTHEIEWKRNLETPVAARDYSYHFFVLDRKGTTRITWERMNADESPKSSVSASIYFVDPTAACTGPDDVPVQCVTLPAGQTSAELPSAPVDEALLCICLDHRASWITAHTFKLRVSGSRRETE